MTSLSIFSQPYDLSRLLAAQRRLESELDLRQTRARLEGSLIDFVEAAWTSFDPSEYQQNWAIDALCEHLQAVTQGQIKRLLVNFPPRCAKTNVASICFPAWTWARSEKTYLSGPQVRFLCGSYNDELSLQNATGHRRLLASPIYQKYWGKRFVIRSDQNTKTQFDNSAGGTRVSTSARGSLLGRGGDIILVDDPHNTKQAESEAERLQSLTWWREISTTRLNDPKQSAIVVIMQRLHEEDVSGVILSSGWSSDWTHLMIPMEYEWRRHCVTVLGWQDPRGCDENGEPLVAVTADGRVPIGDTGNELDRRDGDLMWPERFGRREIDRIKAELGPYMASGRLQQMPQPSGGGIFERSWWQLWEHPEDKFPQLEYVIASLDGAYTEKEENDPCAMTVWGIFNLEEGYERTGVMGNKIYEKKKKNRRAILLHAWRKHLRFSGPRIDYRPHETRESYKRRTSGDWGLMEWVEDTCHRFKVHKLLIEAKANGISAAQELQNRYGIQPWAVHLCKVSGDKVARALVVQPTFSQGLVYAPEARYPYRDWPDLVIDELATFPKGKYDDLTDSTTQALKYLRDTGMLMTDREVEVAAVDRVTHKSQPKPLYPV